MAVEPLGQRRSACSDPLKTFKPPKLGKRLRGVVAFASPRSEGVANETPLSDATQFGGVKSLKRDGHSSRCAPVVPPERLLVLNDILTCMYVRD